MFPDTLWELVATYFVFVVVIAVISALLWIFLKICQWIVFQKAGQSGWKALIPIYDTFVMLRIIQRPQWWGYLIIIMSAIQIIITMLTNENSSESGTLSLLSNVATIVSFIYSVRITNGLSRSFGRGLGFTLGLLFFPYIFYPILAFGSSTYRSAYE